MGKVISAGHICLDITPVFQAGTSVREIGQLLVPGKLIQMEGASVHTGGSVANTGLALKLLGNDATRSEAWSKTSSRSMARAAL